MQTKHFMWYTCSIAVHPVPSPTTFSPHRVQIPATSTQPFYLRWIKQLLATVDQTNRRRMYKKMLEHLKKKTSKLERWPTC